MMQLSLQKQLFIQISLTAMMILVLIPNSWGQWEKISTEDKTYDSNLKTVQFDVKNVQIGTPPILKLGGGLPLVLSFDDFNEDLGDYEYTVFHCTADWKISSIRQFEYIKEFTTRSLMHYQSSMNSRVPYVHYQEEIPNEQIQLKLSGNYILVLYEAGTENLIMVKRFMVLDHKFSITGEVETPNSPEVDIRNSYQEVIFNVSKPEANDVMIQDISATIMQNANWKNAIYNAKADFERREYFIFGTFGKHLFNGMSEFRNLDLRNINDVSPDVKNITRFNDGIEVELFKDLSRQNNRGFYTDVNGDFVISDRINTNNTDSILVPLITKEIDEFQYRNEYLDAFFSLEAPFPLPKGESVYIWGGITNFELNDNFKLEYNYDYNQYEIWSFLKQGFYNYLYVVKDKKGNIHFDVFEHNRTLTENFYHIFLYHKPPGQRYDALVGTLKLSSFY